MTRTTGVAGGFIAPRSRRSSGKLPQLAIGVLVLGLTAAVGGKMLVADRDIERAVQAAAEEASTSTLVVSHAPLLDPAYSLGAPPVSFVKIPALRADARHVQPIAQGFAKIAAVRTAATELATAKPQPLEAAEVPPPAPVAAPVVQAALAPPPPVSAPAIEAGPIFPAPPPRPPEFAAVAPRSPITALRRPASSAKTTVLAKTEPVDNRTFFEKLFGGGASNSTPSRALAYAPADGGLTSGGFLSNGGASGVGRAGYDRFTAIYDISAKKVYLPSGATLEAHSGLGDKIDNPRHVHVRMKGSTPPNVYDLRPREALFHGVAALRMIPTDRAAMHGRDGILAHTYMLGPNGDSNGCVSFRDYDAFLRAYRNGEVRKLAVVAKL